MSERRLLLGSGLVLVAAAIAVALLPRFLGHAWLAALFFWSGVPVGSIGFLLIMSLVRGKWRDELQPAFAAGAIALPVTMLTLLPIVPAMAALYPWVDRPPKGFAGGWLQPWPFVLRGILWLGGLSMILVLLRRESRAVAGVGLLFLVPMGSLVAIDWLMSLDPAFHSSGFGLQVLAIQFTVALMVAVARAMRAASDPSGTIGALMLTLLMFWGYFAYLPFFIIWSGNIPAGAAWYGARAAGGWGVVAALAGLLHAIPLLALLFPVVRRGRRPLIACAASSLIGDALQAAWLVLPADGALAPATGLAFIASLLVIGVPTLLAGIPR